MNLDGYEVKVKLHGEIAVVLGRSEWCFYVFSMSEALQALDVCSDGKLMQFLTKDILAAFNFVINGEPIQDYRELITQTNGGTLEVFPVIRGRGNDSGAWLAIVGIIVIAIVLIASSGTAAPGVAGLASSSSSGFAALTSSSYVLTGAGSYFLTLGVTLTLAGFASLLAPRAASDSSERPENKPSYLYSGPINTYRQGNPVQVGVGILAIGSQVISGAIRNVDYVSGNERYEFSFIEEVLNVHPEQDYPSQPNTSTDPNAQLASLATSQTGRVYSQS